MKSCGEPCGPKAGQLADVDRLGWADRNSEDPPAVAYGRKCLDDRIVERAVEKGPNFPATRRQGNSCRTVRMFIRGYPCNMDVGVRPQTCEHAQGDVIHPQTSGKFAAWMEDRHRCQS